MSIGIEPHYKENINAKYSKLKSARGGRGRMHKSWDSPLSANDFIIYDGTIQYLHISSESTGYDYDHYRSTFSQGIIDYLFAHPDFEINITVESKPETIQIQPSVKELEELALKEHQTKVKPKIQKTTQLPSGVAGICAQYCTPLEEQQKE